jgi:hypothetical protein
MRKVRVAILDVGDIGRNKPPLPLNFCPHKKKGKNSLKMKTDMNE